MKIGIIIKEENLSFFVWHFIMAVFGSRKVSRKEINIKENCFVMFGFIIENTKKIKYN